MAASHPSSRSVLTSLSATATELEVRGLIDALRDSLQSAAIDQALEGSVAVAVAEALNNIVEHAYTDGEAGPIRLTAELFPDTLRITLQDEGRALPGNALPAGRLPSMSGPRDSLPEGGFGWFLIHELSHSLTYNRRDGKNTLCLNFSRAST